MIHLTLIIVDFLTGLLAAGAWALASAGGAIAALVGGGLLGASLFRKWRQKAEDKGCQTPSISTSMAWRVKGSLKRMPKRLPSAHMTRPLACTPNASTMR